MSEKKSRLDKYKEIIEQYHLTAEDIRQYIRLISIYYYYKVNGEGLRPVDVVIEVNPHPSDVMNLIAFAAAYLSSIRASCSNDVMYIGLILLTLSILYPAISFGFSFFAFSFLSATSLHLLQ